MLHVLTAQIVADERERAIQRRLGKRSALLEARAARAAEPGTLKVADWGSGRIAGQPVNVRFVSKADIEPDVRFARAGSSDRCNREWVEVLLDAIFVEVAEVSPSNR